MKATQWLKRHSILIACICVAVLLALAYFCLEMMFERTLGAVKEQNDTIAGVMSSQARTELDAMLRSVTDMSTLIASNPMVTQFSGVGAPKTADEHYRLYQLISSFYSGRNLLSGNSLFLDFAVYYPSGDVLVTSSAYHRTHHYYNDMYGDGGPAYDQWIAMLSSQVSGRFMPEAGTEDVLVYMQSLDLSAVPSANVLLFLNKRQLRRYIAALEQENCRVYVCTDNMALGSMAGEDPLRESVMGYAFGGDAPAGTSCLMMNSALYRNISYCIVSLPGAEASPLQLSLRQFYSTALVVAVIIMLVLLGLILAWLLPRTARIAAGLRAAAVHREKPTNSISLVRQAMEQALSRDGAGGAAGQWPLLKDALLDKLTRGGSDHGDLVRSLSMYNIQFPHPFFQVALFRLQSPVNTSDLAKLALLFDAPGGPFPGESAAGACFKLGSDSLAALFNTLDQDVDLAPRVERMRRIIRQAQGQPVTALLGSAQRGFDSIRQSYDDAVGCGEYVIFFGDDATIDSAACQGDDAQYFYPMDVELKLISAVKSGSQDQVTSILDGIRRENFEKRQLRPDIARVLLSELIGTALKVLDDSDADGASPAETILKCRTVTDVMNTLTRLYLAACRQGRQPSPDSERKRAFDQYIQSHYTNPDFSQSSMADDLNLSPNYLSAQFKSYFDTTMTAYVTSLRVRRVAELLRETEATVADIAVQVGFGGADALSRAFKKEYGITPGGYRNGARRT